LLTFSLAKQRKSKVLANTRKTQQKKKRQRHWHVFFHIPTKHPHMSNKYNDATPNRPEGERIIDAPTVFIDLPAYIVQIKTEDAWHKNDRNSITVFKTDDMCVVLGALHHGAEMTHRKAEGIMTVQVLDGTLEIFTDDLTTLAQKGHIVAIHKRNSYRIIAREESMYLLTISDMHL
jgi:quercetin dioxygenase-like cupin family protein